MSAGEGAPGDATALKRFSCGVVGRWYRPARAMKRRRRLGWAAVAALGLALLSVADEAGFRRYFRLRREVAALEARTERLRAQNAALAAEVQALGKDPRAIERAAREELGFVKPGEVVLNLEAP